MPLRAIGPMLAVPFFTALAVLLWPLFRAVGLPM